MKQALHSHNQQSQEMETTNQPKSPYSIVELVLHDQGRAVSASFKFPAFDSPSPSIEVDDIQSDPEFDQKLFIQLRLGNIPKEAALFISNFFKHELGETALPGPGFAAYCWVAKHGNSEKYPVELGIPADRDNAASFTTVNFTGVGLYLFEN